ncbi:MAG: PTS transporter subunit EIIC [Tractidigestivibacter sp.]|jgi:PTS system beta-glucosides-specific IIC component|uniref:PTS transporter subunit EIIC n=1 Tax=Tractidigestivibacter sp. TaxID=2847320 RepID=UPI003D8FA69F
MAAKKDYAAMRDQIIEACGGVGNIASVTHCMTRLRVQLKDQSKLNEEAGKSIKGVLTLVVQNGENQFVIGQDVPSLYEEFQKVDGINAAGVVDDPEAAAADTKDPKDHGKVVSAILSFLGDTFSPVIPVIIAGGLMGAVLSLLVNFFGVSTDSGTYRLFSYINQATFYFLPVFIGFSAATRLKSNGYLGAFLGAILLYYTINIDNGSLDLFGIPVAQVTYNATVFPIILGVLLMSVVYRWFQKVLPDVLRTVFAPLLTMLVVAPVTLIVLAPIGYTIGTGLATVLLAVYHAAPAVAVAFVGCFTPWLVFFGMNNALYPLQFTLMAEVGSDPLICAGMVAANMAVAGACMAAARIEKDVDEKSVAIGAGISALCSITEPGVYGVLFTKRFPLKGAMVGGVIGGALAGITGMTQYVITACSFIAFPAYISPDGSFTNLWLALLVMAVSFAVGFVATLAFGKGTQEKGAETVAQAA